jgi:hypothetical protein
MVSAVHLLGCAWTALMLECARTGLVLELISAWAGLLMGLAGLGCVGYGFGWA